MLPRGEDLLWWMEIIAGLSFMAWWPLYQFRRYEKSREPQEEECTRCGRMVEHIDLHLRYCKGQIARRNPLSGRLSTMFRAYKTGEMTEEIPDVAPVALAPPLPPKPVATPKTPLPVRDEDLEEL